MTYLKWLTENTCTRWWHDSAIPAEIDAAIKDGALGVTTNPVLTYKAFLADPAFWQPEVDKIPQNVWGTERVEALLKIVAGYAAAKFWDVYEKTDGEHGYALGQVNPSLAHDREGMLAQGRRYASWAPNIAVKLPTVGASLPVIEALAEDGIAVCTTLNFSVAQALAAGEAYERGAKKAKAAGKKVAPCFVVQQGGRLDDYLFDVAADNRLDIAKEDIANAGNAVCKRSYNIYKEKGITAKIMPAGLRGAHHIAGMSGADMVFSLQTRVQKLINEADPPRREMIDEPVDPKSIERLMAIDEFRRAYEPDGLKVNDFVKFGVTQKTLSQFLWSGWAPLETYGVTATTDRWF